MKQISKIAELRKKAGLTQIELAKLLGVTETTIQNWENGRGNLEWIERVIKLCRLFQCSPEDLVKLIPDDKPTEKTKRLNEMRDRISRGKEGNN